MITFRPIELRDQAWVSACRDSRQHPFSALSFQSLYSWRNTYGLTITGDSDFFAVHSNHDHAYYCPCGDPDKCRAFVEEVCATEEHPHFLYLTREEAERMRQAGFTTLLRDDLSEYISSTPGLAMTNGYHITHSFRNKVNRFQRSCPYTVRAVTEADLPALKQLLRQFESMSADGHEDVDVVETELDAFRELGISGILLETQDGRSAFLLAYENNPVELTMTLSKYDPTLPGVMTAVLLHEMAVMKQRQYPLTNLEEDLGITGLRQAKILYSPVDRLNVYEAIA